MSTPPTTGRPRAFDVLLAKLDRRHRVEPTLTLSDLAGIAIPMLLMFADDDEVEFDHIGLMYRSLPDLTSAGEAEG